MNDLKAKIARALLDLGDTPDAIAAFLEGQGIRGVPNCDIDCPVAQYLNGLLGSGITGAAAAMVGDLSCWWLDFDGIVEVVTPHAVGCFIDAFDHGAYPALVRRR